MTANTFDRSESFSWWASLKHGGLLIAPGKLTEFFDETVSPLSPYLTERLRRDVFAVLEGSDDKTAGLLDTVFEQVLGFPKTGWIKGGAVDASWTRKAITGEAVKPRRVWKGAHGEVLPVFIPDAETLGQAQRLGVGRGRRAASRVVEWLRLSGQKIGVLTNGHQLRLIHAGVDYEAWCEWDIDLWFQEGAPGPQVEALRILLDRRSLESPDGKTTGPLLSAIAASRKGQAELSSVLGERVRLAVEKLIEASTEAIEKLDNGERREETRRVIYIAATRLVMRMVVVLFAEARELLPRDNPIYNSSYGLQGLREQLERLAGGRGTERLRHTASAWPRLLGLFRLIYEGSRHEALVVQKYGGGLFQPGDATSSDPVLKALSPLEHPANAINDAVIHGILELLTRSKVKVRQGKGSTWVEAPVDFSDLSSEYIGILYEGLLDFELRRADPGDPMVFLNLGDQPALPFSRLEEMDDKALSQMLEKLKKSTKKAAPTEGDGDGEESEEAEDDLDAEEPGDEAEVEEGTLDAGEPSAEEDASDDASLWSGRIQAWSRRAAVAAKLIKPPRGKKGASASDAFEQELSKVAKQLIFKTVLPGGWFLVRWGGTRKGAGTFYTRPQLAGPTTRRTLEPLLYEEGTSESRLVRKPEDILSLKVCDPAMGSGSFLVSALRILVDALFESLHVHNRLEGGEDRTICRLADGLPASSPKHETLTVPLKHEDFEVRLKARLKRHVVERCLYGVDIDPLAVELARMSLWIETMDRNLPFHFLDHKLKCGNSLVGCWFDRFQDYPVMAWEREGGDKNHTLFVHHFHEQEATKGKKAGQTQLKGDKWTQAIKDFRDSVIKPEMRAWITARSGNVFSFMKDGYTTEDLHRDIRAVFEELHSLPVHQDDERAALYREQILANPELTRLKAAFDTWCAIWFWPGEELEKAPTPKNFLDPPEATRVLTSELAARLRFFHWEIEFPDVFTGLESGFDALIGNPPWEVQKPNSKEFFSNIDPLYRAYGKQDALRKQKEFFSNDEGVELGWLDYSARLKSLSTWTKHAAFPFGDEETGGTSFNFTRASSENGTLHRLWRVQRSKRKGFSDPEHPFSHQGSADINTYKMFLETAHALASRDGLFGFIVPSGVYTDKGSTDLRELFLGQCRWEWLFGFENREGIFDIHRSFKFCPVIVRKGGTTQAIRATFMRRNLLDWEEGEKHVLLYPRERVEQFSPKSKAILEIRHERDLEILEKLYANGVLLGDQGPDGWGITYAREFDMTNDSKMFPPRPSWEERGYIPNEYGLWLGPKDEIAVPVYNAKMFNLFDFCSQGWVRGKGRSAVWDEIGFPKQLGPEYLMNFEVFLEEGQPTGFVRLLFKDISTAVHYRTMLCSIVPDLPAVNAAPILVTKTQSDVLVLQAILGSLCLDFVARLRIGYLHLNYFIIEELPLPQRQNLSSNIFRLLSEYTLRLCGTHELFARVWLNSDLKTRSCPWRSLWAVSSYERLRLRCILDAVVATLYDLDDTALAWILADCDQPAISLLSDEFTSAVNPKGFWRVDKDKDPELRHTVLSLVAFHDLKAKGLDAFLAQNDGEGWMIPETLRLADYGLGHDDRAKEHQPVASRLGPRFLPWQLEQSVEESWEECRKHAKLISRIVPPPADTLADDSAEADDVDKGQIDIFGQPSASHKPSRRK